MKLKKLLALLLSVCMIMSAFAAYASEEAMEPEYIFSSVAFTYSGEEADSLVGGETLTATVTAEGYSGNNLTFTLIITKNGKVVAADNDTASVCGEENFEVSAALPADITGVEAKAVLWEGYNNMKPVLTASVMPSSDATLTYISVDGTELEGFDPDVTEYTYHVEDPARTDVPDIKVKAANSGSKVEIADPTWYPGKSVITVTAPDGTKKEYTVKYTVDNADFVSNVRIFEDNILPNGEPAQRSSEYIWNGLEIGKICYDDRPQWYITEINGESLQGASIITMNNGWQNDGGQIPYERNLFSGNVPYKWVRFEVTRGLTVRYFHQKVTYPDNLVAMGYEQETTTDYIVGNTRKHAIVYSRHFNAGETAYIPNSHGGDICPIVVIAHDPFGTTYSSLSQITVDGSVIDGFDSNVYEYTYEIPVDTLTAPAIEAFATDDRSHISITPPDTFPGKSVITVTAPGCESTKYTINYVLPEGQELISDLRILDDNKLPDGTEILRDGQVYYSPKGFRNGAMHSSNRTFVLSGIADDFVIGADLIGYAWDTWKDNGAGDAINIYYSQKETTLKWINFTINRDAEVYIYCPLPKGRQADNDKKCEDLGFIYDGENTSPYFMKSSVGVENNAFSGRWKKSVSAGDTVSLPNFRGGSSQGRVMHTIAICYENMEGEDYDNGVVFTDDELQLNLVKYEEDFKQSDAEVANYDISDSEGTLTVKVTGTPGDSIGFALVKPNKQYKENYNPSEIVSDLTALTQDIVSADGEISYVIDMTDEDSGYYIPVINGVVQDGKIFFATAEDRADMYAEIKDILDGKDIAEGETIQTTLVEKLDSANEESLAINTMSVTTKGLATINTSTYAKAIIALYNEDNTLVTNADTLKSLMEDAALIALVDEGKEDIADITSAAGIEDKYISLYEDELSKETKADFSNDYFAGKGYYTRKAVSEAFEEAVLLSFVKDINTQSDAEKLILEFGEDIGIDVEDYKDLKTKQKNNVKNYIIDKLDSITSTDKIADKINSEIEDQADSSGGSSRGGSGGGGGSTGGAGVFAGSEPVVAVNPEEVVTPATGFSDMTGFAWAEDAVNALYEDGIVSGIGNNMFAPQNAVTREEMLTMLLRAYDVDVTGAVSAFKDVPANAWYNAYVAKGFELGVTSGIDSENFGSGRPVTRAEAAAMAYRIATYFGNTFTPETTLFSDDAVIAPWAKEAVYALKGSSVLNGTGDGNFAPLKGCTRAEAAKIVYGLINR